MVGSRHPRRTAGNRRDGERDATSTCSDLGGGGAGPKPENAAAGAPERRRAMVRKAIATTHHPLRRPARPAPRCEATGAKLGRIMRREIDQRRPQTIARAAL